MVFRRVFFSHGYDPETRYFSVRRGGRAVCIGLPHPDKKVSLPALAFAGEEKSLIGSYMGSCVPQRDIPRFMAMHRAGLLPVDLLTSRILKLSEVNGAFDALDQGLVARQVIRF